MGKEFAIPECWWGTGKNTRKQADQENPSCISRELPGKVQDFLDYYEEEVGKTVVLQNHSGPVICTSDLNNLASRKKALAEYFCDYFTSLSPMTKGDKERYQYGRTILAEVVSYELLGELLAEGIDREDMALMLAPTSIDRSSYSGEDYQKGADIVLVEIGAGDSPHLPVLGIDVTVGDLRFVKAKLSNPGVQCKTAMPVVVLPLRKFSYEGKNNFLGYLDRYGRESVTTQSWYEPFYGLNEKDVLAWKQQLRKGLRDGINKCRAGLQTCPHSYITSFKYLDHVYNQLDRFESLV